MIGKTFRRYGWKSVLLASVLLLSACAAQMQLGSPSNLPRRAASQTRESDATPTASSTPGLTSTLTEIVPTFNPVSKTPTPAADLVEALREGGYVIYIHTEPQNDSEEQSLEDCPLQLVLSEQGQTNARTIGSSFLALGIPVSQVLHSGSCSSRDAAMLMFNRGEHWTDTSEIALRGERIAALRQMLSTQPQPGTNNVIVGHGADITDLTEITFDEGEIAVYKPLGEIGYSFVERVLPETWDEVEKNTTGLVQIEAYDSDSIPLEEIDATHEPNDWLHSEHDEADQIPVTGSLPAIDQSLLLPDLITLPPTDLRIRVHSVSGEKLLRFTNLIMNNGPGKIELWGESNLETGKVTVTQFIYRGEGIAEKVVVGEFFFHDEHNHWHLGDFARYEILSVGAEGELDSVVALSNKVSYCLRDDERSDIPSASRRQTYTSCDQRRQGISVGWIDIYRYHLQGQSINITSLPDGIYALRSTVDPANSLFEEDRDNNTAILYIEIEGNSVSVIELADIRGDQPDNQNR